MASCARERLGDSANASSAAFMPLATSFDAVSDSAYLERVRAEMAEAGINCTATLAFGEPVKEIVNWVQQHSPDLVAMSTHGHQLVADLVLGTTAINVQHSVSVPVLMLRAK